MAFKANVVKFTWEVQTEMENYRNIYLVEAESEETARLKVPKDEVIISVRRMDGS